VNRVTDTLAPAAQPPHPPVYQPRYDPLTRLWMRLWERPAWVAPAAVLTCMGAAATYVLAVDPTEPNPDLPVTCLVKLTTGFDCPGCGGTRSMWYILHGNLPEAARHHALWTFAFPFLIYMYVAWAGKRIFKWRLPQFRLPSVAIGAVLAVWFIFSVIRNLPWAPFTWLYV